MGKSSVIVGSCLLEHIASARFPDSLNKATNNSGDVNGNRDVFYDVVKGIGIVCVYLGHSFHWGTLPSRMIFNFHMPLFFLVAGVFFRPEKYRTIRDLLLSVWAGLLMPYFFFVIVNYVVVFDVQIPNFLASPVSVLYRLFVHGDGGAIWFLVCLAGVKCLTWFLRRVGKFKITLWIAAVVVAHLISRFCAIRIIRYDPFMSLSIPCAAVFFWLGSLFRCEVLGIIAWLTDSRRCKRIFFALVAAFVAVTSLLPGTFDLRLAHFHCARIIPCVIGIASVFCLAKMMLFGCVGRTLGFLGRYSLCFFALESCLSHVYCHVLRFVGLSAPCGSFYLSDCSLMQILCRNLVVLLVAALLSPWAMKLITKLRKGFF